jgi:hypothetical protein
LTIAIVTSAAAARKPMPPFQGSGRHDDEQRHGDGVHGSPREALADVLVPRAALHATDVVE